MTHNPQQQFSRTLVLAGLLVLACAAQAAGEAQTRYRQELAICNSGQSNQDAGTCRREARNALAESRRNGLTDPADQAQANALQRCKAHEGDDRRACEVRMGAQGTTEGSISAGGILRQGTITIPAN
jgi:hypothetical protein